MPRKSSKGKGGKKGGKAGKDPVTGRYMQETEDGRTFLVRDDGIYHYKDNGTPDYLKDDTLTLLGSAPAEADGIHVADSVVIQHQFGDKAVVISSSRDTIRQRDVYVGDFTYDKKGRLTGGRVEFHAYIEEQPSFATPSERIGGGIYQATDPTYKPFSEWDTSTVQLVDDDDPATGGLPAIRAFGGGKYFYEGWYNSLFDTSLA
jgi:hypothetical protein